MATNINFLEMQVKEYQNNLPKVYSKFFNNDQGYLYSSVQRYNNRSNSRKYVNVKSNQIKNNLKLLKFILRSIVIVISSFGFCYQSLIMSYTYFKHDTVITFENDVKDFVDLPAITLCTAWFSERQTPEEKNLTAIKLMEITRKATEDWISCSFEGNTIAVGEESSQRTNCSDVSPVIMTRTAKWNNKCFTFFSQLNKTNKSDDHFRVSRRNGEIGILIKLWNRTNWLVDFTLHSPLMIPSLRGSDFILMETGKWYRIVFTRTKYHLLEAPWRTNCTNYGIKSKMKIESQSECYTKCLTRERKKVCNCLTLKQDDSHRIDWISVEDKFCDDSEAICPQDNSGIYSKCEKECPNDCLKDYFDYLVTTQKFENSLINIHVRHSQAKGDTTITHSPGMDFGVYVANIGGLAGIWLGFSTIALYDKIVKYSGQIFKYLCRTLNVRAKTL